MQMKNEAIWNLMTFAGIFILASVQIMFIQTTTGQFDVDGPLQGMADNEAFKNLSAMNKQYEKYFLNVNKDANGTIIVDINGTPLPGGTVIDENITQAGKPENESNSTGGLEKFFGFTKTVQGLIDGFQSKTTGMIVIMIYSIPQAVEIAMFPVYWQFDIFNQGAVVKAVQGLVSASIYLIGFAYITRFFMAFVRGI